MWPKRISLTNYFFGKEKKVEQFNFLEPPIKLPLIYELIDQKWRNNLHICESNYSHIFT